MSNRLNNKFLFHVGYHKTGSALLQKILFSGTFGYFASDHEKRQQIIEAFVSPPPLDGADVAELQRLLQNYSDYDDSLVRVISHERLAGYPASGGIDQGIIALRIKEHFPDARILMVVREQDDIILSMYYQYIRDGGSLSLKNYLLGIDRQLHRSPQFSFEYYEYDKALDMYRAHFGHDHVLCLPYEMLACRPDLFIKLLFNFCQLGEPPAHVIKTISSTRVNSRRSILELYFFRFANKVFRTQLSDYGCQGMSLGQLRGVFDKFSHRIPQSTVIKERQEIKDKETIRSMSMNRYQKSNSALGKLINVELADYGYNTQEVKKR